MIKYTNCPGMDSRWDRTHRDLAIKHFICQFVIAEGGWKTFRQDVKFIWLEKIPIKNEFGMEDSRRSFVVEFFPRIGIVIRVVLTNDRQPFVVVRIILLMTVKLLYRPSGKTNDGVSDRVKNGVRSEATSGDGD
jgi:hypothetical protein